MKVLSNVVGTTSFGNIARSILNPVRNNACESLGTSVLTRGLSWNAAIVTVIVSTLCPPLT